MNLLTFRSEEDLNRAGAGLIASLLQSNPRSVLGLATGSTPIGIYAELVKLYESGSVSFAKARSYNLDEYVGLSGSHPASYRCFMNTHLFDRVDIDPANTHVPNGLAKDLEQECAYYDAMIEDDRIDLQLLGLGHNGHIGFNEPDDELIPGTHAATLQQQTREANARFFNSQDDVPKQAITMGVAGIMKAAQIMLVVRGAAKADIARQALTGPITTQCPASLLQLHPNLVVLMDEAAGAWAK
ncbi:glucosamine-6-phosphate deaminase [Saccharibacillus kuerlensis]|uniref:Glucosamine-6-phosphate deaminase n=1 Tax=Saccharibacillus kuerlensis TaxID=459527 RepID=A0ABQ2L5F1_9BACL|nr:glucosamine-6-phosphate deaminase [Saccharibacillus kuerlensis]GGO03502.1 glucosamine-6-phosphate deaminase [Saccharibacillus kuerlensis]